METHLVYEQLAPDRLRPYVQSGPLLSDVLSNSAMNVNDYVSAGGYEVGRQAICLNPEAILDMIDQSGLRGRGGGGFPTGHKWRMVAESENKERYFICNANAGQPGGFKERFLIQTSPHRIIESVVLAAHALRATTAIICLPQQLDAEADLLEKALEDATDKGLLGNHALGLRQQFQIVVYRYPGRYISGEETALMELIEGRAGRPRGKPPMPTAQGLFGSPTAVNNLETVLHVYHIIKHGAANFRQIGTSYSPGSLVFSVSGNVKRPGLYELPLGTSLRELIACAQGVAGGRRLKAVFAGGISSPPLAAASLDVALDYDTAHDVGFDMGSGAVVVVAEPTSAIDLTRHLAEFFHEKSCGKCKPCKDGTKRTLQMLNNLDRLDGEPVESPDQKFAAPAGTSELRILNNAGRISYTDAVQGLNKIRHLCEFYKYRGDCHHCTESANSIQRLLHLFPEEFEAYRTKSI